MFWLGLMQCVGWVTYSASPRVAAEYYGFENPKASIDMLLNWGPIMPLGATGAGFGVKKNLYLFGVQILRRSRVDHYNLLKKSKET